MGWSLMLRTSFFRLFSLPSNLIFQIIFLFHLWFHVTELQTCYVAENWSSPDSTSQVITVMNYKTHFILNFLHGLSQRLKTSILLVSIPSISVWFGKQMAINHIFSADFKQGFCLWTSCLSDHSCPSSPRYYSDSQ